MTAFVVGVLLVSGDNESLRSLPGVGKLVELVGLEQKPKLDKKVINTPENIAGVRKGVGDADPLYIVTGKLIKDVVVREGEGVLQGEMIVDGHLQSQFLGQKIM